MYSSAEEVSVSTVAATATATGHHLLKIEGYSRPKKMHGNGRAFMSSEFEAAGHSWAIRCYPNGQREEDAGFFSVFLVLADAAAESVMVAEYEFALVNHHGTSASSPPYDVRSVATFCMDNSWGFPTFISHDALEESRFLKDDCFAVRCKISTIETSVVKEEVVQAQDLERLGMARTAEKTKGLKQGFGRFFRSLCGSTRGVQRRSGQTGNQTGNYSAEDYVLQELFNALGLWGDGGLFKP